MAVTVRMAEQRDARTIARIRVDAWRAAYARLISSAVLDQLDAEAEGDRRVANWDRGHADPRRVDVIAEVDGVAAGWAACGASDDPSSPGGGKLFALYVAPPHWSTGVGHALMSDVEARLRRAGHARAHLWVLAGNTRAADFYERHGWHEDGGVMTDDRVIGGHTAFTLHERRRVRDLRLPPSP